MFKPVILSLGSGYKVRNSAGEDLGKIEEIVLAAFEKWEQSQSEAGVRS